MYDYYVYKRLKIHHKNGISYITLTSEGYDFYIEPCVDSDDEDYDNKCKEWYDKYLVPDFEPVTIFKDQQFINEKLKNKYAKMIEKKIEKIKNNELHKNDIGTFSDFNEIILIEKVEMREFCPFFEYK